MIIQKTEPYDEKMAFSKEIKVIEYCCVEMAKDMKANRGWYYDDVTGEMSCADWESGFSGKFCSHCGEKIIIK